VNYLQSVVRSSGKLCNTESVTHAYNAGINFLLLYYFLKFTRFLTTEQKLTL